MLIGEENIMNNVLLDELPKEWKSNDGKKYPINWWFQIGIQIFLLKDDEEMSDQERIAHVIDLLFDDNPIPPDLDECVKWFLNGWNHDNTLNKESDIKILDFDVDQFRIYADFRQIYGINLNDCNLHWWEFMGLLWNMPHEQSSFIQVIDIRKKKIKPKMSAEEKKAIKEAQQVYGLGKRDIKKEYTPEQIEKIDDFDRMMEERRNNRNLIIQLADKY